MGQTPTDDEVLELMAAVDEDNSGAIDFLEFMNMVRCSLLFHSAQSCITLPVAQTHSLLSFPQRKAPSCQAAYI